jgi:hypothetical protein
MRQLTLRDILDNCILRKTILCIWVNIILFRSWLMPVLSYLNFVNIFTLLNHISVGPFILNR